MDLSDAENALLSHIREARESRETTTTRAEESGIGVEGAYKVQAAMGEGRKVLGYKLGLIAPAKQAQMGVDSPMYGRVYEDMILASPVNLSSMIQPRRLRGRANDLLGSPAAPVEATPGTIELHGPRGSVLVADQQED